jgi:hypothetical protein
MPESGSIDHFAQLPFGRAARTPAPASAEARFFAEDGWVFRERPGQGIECVARYDQFVIEPAATPSR